MRRQVYFPAHLLLRFAGFLLTLHVLTQASYAQKVADTARVQEREVVVTAVRPSDLPTIDPRDIATKQTATLYNQTGTLRTSDALRAMSSSLDIRRNGPIGSIALPSFRGLPTSYTLVYRDGIRITPEQNSFTDLGQLSLNGVSTIELIPATSALLLGGDAIGAAINLVSATSDTALIRAGTELTSYENGKRTVGERLVRADLAVRPTPSVALRLGASEEDAPGDFPFFDSLAKRYILRENNDMLRHAAYFTSTWQADEASSVRLLTHYFTIDRGLPGAATTAGRGASTLTTRQGDEQSFLALRLDHDREDWHGSLAVHYQSQFETYRDAAYATNDRGYDRIYGLNFTGDARLSGWLHGYSGIEYLHSRLASTTNQVGGDSIFSRDRVGAYVAGNVIPFEGVSIAGSLRLEKLSDVSASELLPQAAITYAPFDNLRFSAAFSKSFHAPTLNDLYWKGFGNASLHSERGKNWQASVQYEVYGSLLDAAGLQLATSITAFDASIQDAILWVDGALGLTRPINVQNVRSRGLEFVARIDWALNSRWGAHIEAGYTLLAARNETENDKTNGNELPNSSPTSGLLVAQVVYEPLGSLALLSRYRGHKYRTLVNNQGDMLPPVSILDLTVASRPVTFGNVAGQLRLTVQNLANTHYAEILNYPMPGRSFKLSIELSYQ